MAKNNFKDLTNQRFGRLTALRFLGREKSNSYWECKCDCGNICKRRASHITSGASSSCGCYNKEVAAERLKTHGLSDHPLMNIHNAMISRCENKNSKSHKYYGAKGRSVCERWHDFKNFYDDMVDGYRPGLTLEREDVNGNYEPLNCYWATPYEQARNRTDNVFIEFNGERMIMADWATKVGIKKGTLWHRLNSGWTLEKALTPTLKTWNRRPAKQNT